MKNIFKKSELGVAYKKITYTKGGIEYNNDFQVSSIVYRVLHRFFRYNQVCNPEYVFDVDRAQENADKFVQVVWKDTKRFGIGRSTFQKDGKFCTVVVARYSPPTSKSNARSNVIRGVFDHGSYCNGLGRSSIPAVETDNTQKAIKSASQNTQGRE